VCTLFHLPLCCSPNLPHLQHFQLVYQLKLDLDNAILVL
jgi:hypothetical protein